MKTNEERFKEMWGEEPGWNEKTLQLALGCLLGGIVIIGAVVWLVVALITNYN